MSEFSQFKSTPSSSPIDVKDAVARGQLQSTQTATGNPLTLTDCAPINAESLVVELLPKQDLHGQSAPYVGGVGKNKLPMTVDGIKAANTSGSWSGNVYTINSGTFTILTDDGNNVIGIKANGTFNASTTFILANSSSGIYPFISNSMILNGCPSGGSTSTYRIQTWRNGRDVMIDTGGGVLISYPTTSDQWNAAIIVSSSTQLSNAIFYPMIRLSTETDATFAPYSNICPITGYTECEVDDVGKNLFDASNTVGGAVVDGEVVIDGRADGWITDYDIPFDTTTLYVYVKSKGTYIGSLFAKCFDKNYTYIGETNAVQFGQISVPYNTTITLQSGTKHVRIVGWMLGGVSNIKSVEVMISNTAITTYEPYHSSNATIQFGQTVYGGTVDFKTGNVTVDRALVDLGTDATFEYVSALAVDNIFPFRVSNRIYDSAAVAPISDKIKVTKKASWSIDENEIIYIDQQDSMRIRIPNCTTVAQIETATTGIHLCYEFAAPTTLQLTPQELKLLQNTNNISTNGTTITLGYQPDNVIGELKGDIQAIIEMDYLRILDNNVDIPINNYRIYYHFISGAYTLVNMDEMLQHRFIFVEVVYNPSGSGKQVMHSVLIDPRTIDGFEYRMKANENDTIWIESLLSESKFSLSLRTTGGSYSDGDPTDYYVTIRMVD